MTHEGESPGPMPILTMSAPDNINSSTISPVTTLPACVVVSWWLSVVVVSWCWCCQFVLSVGVGVVRCWSGLLLLCGAFVC